MGPIAPVPYSYTSVNHKRKQGALKKEQGFPEGALCHYDTPLTVEHETELLRNAGFGNIRVMKSREAACILIAERQVRAASGKGHRRER